MTEIETLKEENRRLSRELQQRLFELSLLYEISNNISYTLDYDDCLRLIMESLHKIIDYDICASLVILEEEEKPRMSIHIAHPVGEKIIEEIKRKVIDSLSDLRGRPVLEQEVIVDIKRAGREDNAPSQMIKSSFDVPLFVQEKPIGILNVGSARDIAYTDEAIKLLYTIASQAAAAIERLRATLSAEKSKMKFMVEGMSEGVIMFDQKERIVIFNRAAKDMLGYIEKESGADSLIRFFQEIGLIASPEELGKIEKSPFVKELYLAKPYPRVIRVTAKRIDDERQLSSGIVIVSQDVTKERELDQIKDDFVSLVSHELRTPLAAIKGATDNLLDGIAGELNALQKDCLLISKRNLDRLSRLISGLLDISRIEAGQIQLNKEIIDMPPIIKDVLRLFAGPAKERKLRLSASFENNLPKLEADPDNITQVITNLMNNALKFTPAGGEIAIKVSLKENFMRIDVIDNGSGIPVQDLDKIFDKFYQVVRADGRHKKGAGLGLPICKGIVEKHGGRIWAESQIGQGSKFSFTLPLNNAG